MELTTCFQGLLSRIEPSASAVAVARKAHEELRDTLQKDDEISKANPESYLSGSYARDTALNHIKDVDVILLLDIDHKTTEPAVAIAWLQASIQKYYSEVIAQGRSVGVTTEGGFALDVVPAVALTHSGGPVWIPDRDVKQWVISHPKGQIEFGAQKNDAIDGFYKPLVKIMKHWRDRIPSETARPKSYIVETLVAEAASTTPVSYGQAVADVFRSICSRYSGYLALGQVPRINDPGYPSVNVAKRWKFNEFSAYVQQVHTASAIAASALQEQDKGTSTQQWKILFGEKFCPKE